MPLIPDLAQSGKTDADLRPHCTSAKVRKRKGSGAVPDYLWTLTLEWELEEGEVRAEHTLPRKFRAFRPEMLRAYGKSGRPFAAKFQPLAEVEVDLALHTGDTYLVSVQNAAATVKQEELIVSEGKCTMRVLLEVTAKRDNSAEMLDLLGVDVAVAVRATAPLFPEGEDGERFDEQGPDINGHDNAGEAELSEEEIAELNALPPEPDGDNTEPPQVDIERPGDSKVRRRPGARASKAAALDS